ncbi:3-oxoacyl-[acyl-carrier-protein] reductase FabG [Geodia barretti]|uniref:3-oxoacyl-[acyl-carrier-protein] reductase n=1 Tax=Geodia barretti TaxID=519541 RepID=A0AA35W966_GEOBA|nr:3-oxoacyl-[acyl-carrier-protein] reductase FabG [Geodia barretti]
MAHSGARVMVTALTDTYLKPLAEGMRVAGYPILAMTADATDTDDWQRTVDAALSEWGHIDVLINNLGDSIRKPGTPISDDEYRFVLDINLTEAFKGCRAVGPHMIERGRGRVINISGFAARKGSPESLVYSTAKAGLARLTQTLALEWAPYGITVNCIAPGIFPDPETGDPQQIARSRENARETVPLGRVGELQEVGFLALYLASDASSYMTGETLYIDGGLSHS